MHLYGGSSGIIDDVYFLTATNSAAFNSSVIQAYVNNYYDLFVNEIIDAQDDWEFEGQIATADIVANQQDYPFPTDVLTVKRLEIKNSAGNWYNAQTKDENEQRYRAIGTSADINAYWESSDPRYAAHDNSIYLFPVPSAAVTAGLKLWYGKKATAMAYNSAVPDFTAAYHRGLSYGVAKDWFQKIGDQQKSQEMTIEFEKSLARCKKFYSNRLPDREYRLKPLIENYE